MIKKIVLILFILCSVFSTFSEFALSYSDLMSDFLLQFITEQSYLLPFLQLLALFSGIYLLFIHKDVVIRSADLVVSSDGDLSQRLQQELEDKEALDVEKMMNSINDKIRSVTILSQKIEKGLFAFCHEFRLSQGIIYKKIDSKLSLIADFAFFGDKSVIAEIEVGEGVTGQAAKNLSNLYIDDVPNGYLKVVSGLGESYPDYIVIVSIRNGDQLLGMLEVSGLGKLTKSEIDAINLTSTKIFSSLLATTEG